MKFKEDKLYPIYISHLENKNLNTGAFKLAQMSNGMFNEFIHRYENNPDFRDKQDNIYKSIKRGFAIEEILEGEDDFEIILDDMDTSETGASIDIDDNFFDF